MAGIVNDIWKMGIVYPDLTEHVTRTSPRFSKTLSCNYTITFIISILWLSFVDRDMMTDMKKHSLIPAILLLLAFGLSASAQQGAYELPSGDVDLLEFTERISKITGFTFITPKNFSGKAKLIINHKVDAKEAFEIYLSVLADAGFSTIERGSVIRIVPKGEGMDPKLVFKNGEPVGPSDKRITVFIDLTHVSAHEAEKGLRPLISPEGKLLVSPTGNRLIVVDNGANVDKIRKAVSIMDQKGAALKVEIIHLERAGANAVANILNALFPKVGQTRNSSFGGRFSAIADLRTNSIIIQAPENEIKIARKLAKRIDDKDHPHSVNIKYLKNAGADELSDLFKKLE